MKTKKPIFDDDWWLVSDHLGNVKCVVLEAQDEDDAIEQYLDQICLMAHPIKEGDEPRGVWKI